MPEIKGRKHVLVPEIKRRKHQGMSGQEKHKQIPKFGRNNESREE
jgi:hypothetical protein